MLHINETSTDLLYKLEAIRHAAPQHGSRGHRFRRVQRGEDRRARHHHRRAAGESAAMKREIYRRYPLEDKAALVEQLLDRGVVGRGVAGTARRDQPGRCCVTGCQVPESPPGKAAGKAAAE
jgi:hypothetical protein